jgi:hypothetical protein
MLIPLKPSSPSGKLPPQAGRPARTKTKTGTRITLSHSRARGLRILGSRLSTISDGAWMADFDGLGCMMTKKTKIAIARLSFIDNHRFPHLDFVFLHPDQLTLYVPGSVG